MESLNYVHLAQGLYQAPRFNQIYLHIGPVLITNLNQNNLHDYFQMQSFRRLETGVNAPDSISIQSYLKKLYTLKNTFNLIRVDQLAKLPKMPMMSSIYSILRSSEFTTKTATILVMSDCL